MLTLYDAPRCPYCARVRIVLAEKGVEVETVEVDLEDRPAWIYEKNPTGRVPVLEEDGLALPESRVLMEYLEERFPEPPLLPADPAARALARLPIERFDSLAAAYYALRRDEAGAWDRLQERLADLDSDLAARPFLGGAAYSLADVAYLPWILRLPGLGVDLAPYAAIRAWVERLAQRPAVAAELAVVGGLARA